MNLQEISNLSTAISMVIAVLTFIFIVISSTIRRKKEEIKSWQEVSIFKIIQKGGPISFDDVKSKYLEEAQQFTRLRVSKKDISDEVLHDILMNLMANQLIFINEEDEYSLDSVVHDEKHEKYMDFMIEERMFRSLIREVHRQTLQIIGEKPEELNIDSLYVEITKKGIEIDFAEFNGIITTMIVRRLIKINSDQKLSIIRSR